MSNFSEQDGVEEQFMDYEESEEEMVERDNLGDEVAIGDEEADLIDPDIASLQGEKGKPNRHSLEVRRAIEDHLEKTRLRKELDYLFDDDFNSEDTAA